MLSTIEMLKAASENCLIIPSEATLKIASLDTVKGRYENLYIIRKKGESKNIFLTLSNNLGTILPVSFSDQILKDSIEDINNKDQYVIEAINPEKIESLLNKSLPEMNIEKLFLLFSVPDSEKENESRILPIEIEVDKIRILNTIYKKLFVYAGNDSTKKELIDSLQTFINKEK